MTTTENLNSITINEKSQLEKTLGFAALRSHTGINLTRRAIEGVTNQD
ncbi:hypothetical protein QUB19_27925 [Microcoleus sp. B4-C5]